MSGSINGISNGGGGQFRVTDRVGQDTLNRPIKCGDMPGAVEAAIQWLKSQPFILAAIGHPLVQGGPDHRDPQLITDKLLKQLEEFIYLTLIICRMN